MENETYKTHIITLSQRWMTGILTPDEKDDLEIWFRSLEDRSLGPPLEASVDMLERRIYQMLANNSKPPGDDGISPPYPL